MRNGVTQKLLLPGKSTVVAGGTVSYQRMKVRQAADGTSLVAPFFRCHCLPPPAGPPPAPPPPPHTHTHSSSACLLPLQVGHSNGVVLVLPGGLAMRVSQPVAPLATSAAKGKQHRRFQPWLDLYVQLQGRPAAPLGGLLGTTLPQVLGASASPAGLAAALLNTF